MANKSMKQKNKPTRKTLRENEFYNPNTRRYEYRYVDGAKLTLLEVTVRC